jgi:50S ribosome-binding GTPase
MPMPHRIQAHLVKKRLAGKEGQARVNELRAILAELPGYKNGPYADLRKWVEGELAETRSRSRILNRDSISVRREGAAQVAVAGPPNVGKSSLLQALSEIQIRTGDFAFTTLRPVSAVTRIRGVLIQLVEIPGLIEGAHENRGGGRALLGVLRGADGILLCHAAGADPGALLTVRSELSCPPPWPRRSWTKRRMARSNGWPRPSRTYRWSRCRSLTTTPWIACATLSGPSPVSCGCFSAKATRPTNVPWRSAREPPSWMLPTPSTTSSPGAALAPASGADRCATRAREWAESTK